MNCQAHKRDRLQFSTSKVYKPVTRTSHPARLFAECGLRNCAEGVMKAFITIVSATLFASASAPAQDFPVRPIRMVVPLTAGSGADIAGRLIGKFLTDTWHQPVVV